MRSKSKIAKNTIILYVRMLLSAGISIYSVRIILSTLGAEDYGLFNVVGGIVTLLAFLPDAMASASQRFFSHAMGSNDQAKLGQLFTVNCFIYLLFGITALILLALVGHWFIETQLNIDKSRHNAAIILFNILALAFTFTTLSSPFRAVITAYEDMQVLALISILEALLKLACALLLGYLPWDRLPSYGSLSLAVTVLITTLYIAVCRRRYPECRVKVRSWDWKLASEVVLFTTWTLFGQLSTVIRNQGVTLALNQFFGPVVVASRAIALSASGQAGALALSFNNSLYAPIVKAYASGRSDEMMSLVYSGSRITWFLMWILSFPLLIEMEAILKMWLNNPPEHSVYFTRVSILEGLIGAISVPLMTAARAPGRMRTYELTLGSIQLTVLPISWYALSTGSDARAVFLISLAAALVIYLMRLIIVRMLVKLSIKEYCTGVLKPIVAVCVSSSLISYAAFYALDEEKIPFSIRLGALVLFSTGSIYIFGLSAAQRLEIMNAGLTRLKALVKNRKAPTL